MSRIITAVAVILLFGFGFVFANAFAKGEMSKSPYHAYETNGLIGTQVENTLGDVVGSIQDFVIDSSDAVEFVILVHDFYWEYVPKASQSVVVPLSEMTVKPDKKIFVLKFSAWRLDFAPIFEKSEISHRRWVESIYRYFGFQPYWAEASGKAGCRE